MNRILLLVVLLFTGVNVKAQIAFQKKYVGSKYERCQSLLIDADGNYVMAGYTNSFGTDTFDVYVIKTNVMGDTLWTRTIGGLETDQGVDIQKTIDNGYVVVGSTYSFGAGGSDVYLIKLNNSGDTLWTRAYGGASDEGGNSIKQTGDGGFIIAGYTNSFGSGFIDVYILKVDSDGIFQWSKTFGGTSTESAYDIQLANNGFIIAGYTSLGAGNFDAYLINTDFSGNMIWSKKYGGASHDYGYSVQTTSDGGYILVGTILSSGAGNHDVYLIKTNSIGDTLWTKSYGGTLADYGYVVKQMPDDGYTIAGTSYSFFGTGSTSDVYLLNTNATGNLNWSRMIGSVSIDEAHTLALTSDGGFLIGGLSWSFGGGTQYDLSLIKCDSIGFSGCFENTPSTLTSSTRTDVVSPATLVTSTNTITSFTRSNIGNGGASTPLCISVDIQNNTMGNFSFYPNPNSGKFNVQLEDEWIHGEIEVLDLLGRVIYKVEISDKKTIEINLGDETNGVYLIKIIGNKNLFTKKVMISH